MLFTKKAAAFLDLASCSSGLKQNDAEALRGSGVSKVCFDGHVSEVEHVRAGKEPTFIPGGHLEEAAVRNKGHCSFSILPNDCPSQKDPSGQIFILEKMF